MHSLRRFLQLCVYVGLLSCTVDRQSLPQVNTGTDGGTKDGGTNPGSCQSSADCRVAGAAVCDKANSTCVQCLTDGQCPTTETCKHDMLCHGTVACRKDDDCSSAFECGPEQTCVVTPGRCMASNDCLDPAKKACDESSLTCVACVTSSDCGNSGVSSCTSGHVCQVNEGRCLQNSDCDEGVCNTETNYCVQCLGNSDCPSKLCSEHFCAPLGSCVNDSNCVNVSGKKKCDTQEETCVACLSNSDCPNNGTCSDHVCRAPGSCSNDSDCNNVSGRPRCVSNTCVACTSRSDCDGNFCVGNVCQAADYCNSNTDCGSVEGKPYCNTTAHQCVACTTNTQCGSGERCISNACQEYCTSQSDCQSWDRPYCASNGACVECTGTGQCSTGYSCISNTCQFGCAADVDCGFPESHCLTSTRTCVECTSNAHCTSGQTCTSNVCQTTTNTMGCYDILVCQDDCTTTQCQSDCYYNATTAAQSYYATLMSCLFDTACPDSTTNGVCNSAASNYNSANCQTCINNAIATGGTCRTSYSNCVNN